MGVAIEARLMSMGDFTELESTSILMGLSILGSFGKTINTGLEN
jgi:hypothetical protein